ncbi:ABC transporter ATP-binding protein [uncultured Cellulomonas sp.]|uniref:ABC transporter ATP-binding protein n=1 Tax=uncultured Cellulomonas sp. TaxID=189682 RepID=UPI0026173A17|nr:ABC transporter ATP-binding protein [uncultured Cellulomonas sp.]
MSTPAVVVDDVSKSFRVYRDRNQSLKATILRRGRATYEDFWALRDVSLEIPEGGTFGLLGHNGSGKSTMLKCIARILQPNTGTITTRGRVAAMLELGSGFHPELTGRENIYLNGSILGMSKREIDLKLEAIVDFAGIGAFIDQPVKNYSSGMYVRLGFSIAIHVEPDVLLADEILAVGDMQFQEKCREKFAEFRNDGRTVVVVSHGLGEMRSLCDRAAWLDHGTLVDVGKATDIVDEYTETGHAAQEVTDGGMRWGSGEIQVERVELLDAHGQDQRTFRTGDAMTVRLHYVAPGGVDTPVFGASIHTLEGTHLWSHHTRDAGFVPARLQGSGSVDLVVPALPLQPGVFELNTSVVDEQITHDYDQHRRAARFEVMVGAPRESGGPIVLGSRWENFSPPVALVPAGQDVRTATAE